MSASVQAMTAVPMQSLTTNTLFGTASRGLGSTHVMSAFGFLTKSDFFPVADSLGVTRAPQAGVITCSMGPDSLRLGICALPLRIAARRQSRRESTGCCGRSRRPCCRFRLSVSPSTLGSIASSLRAVSHHDKICPIRSQPGSRATRGLAR